MHVEELLKKYEVMSGGPLPEDLRCVLDLLEESPLPEPSASAASASALAQWRSGAKPARFCEMKAPAEGL